MKQTNYGTSVVPTANLAVNKSRIKIYNKEGEMPTYYLQSGQEFQIELFNPTTDVILAKIQLNNKHISQGGLVLNPGQRVFLERYLDVAKKFKFDTYEVSNTQEVKDAIQKNGDFKVDFYREEITYPVYAPILINQGTYGGSFGGPTYYPSSITTLGLASTNTAGVGISNTSLTSTSTAYFNNAVNTSSVTMDSFNDTTFSQKTAPLTKSKIMRSAKTIETGRVEQGSYSNQEMERVSKKFTSYAFHSIEYKLLPISQKVNTLEDINVKVYCTNCAHKLKKEYKFCPVCATRV